MNTCVWRDDITVLSSVSLLLTSRGGILDVSSHGTDPSMNFIS